MKIINKFLIEGKVFTSKFVIHNHNPRSGSEHYDLRFLDNKNSKVLNSFVFGKDFLSKLNSRIIGVRTKDHDIRWLDLKSYRLEDVDKGEVNILISSYKYFKLDFKGTVIKGIYDLFKVKSGRGDNWMLVLKK
jgi:hypothetical protein